MTLLDEKYYQRDRVDFIINTVRNEYFWLVKYMEQKNLTITLNDMSRDVDVINSSGEVISHIPLFTLENLDHMIVINIIENELNKKTTN